MNEGYRRLAAAVVVRAIKDAHGLMAPIDGRKRKAVQVEARAFLAPENPSLQLYCDLLDIDPGRLAKAVKERGRSVLALDPVGQTA